MQFKRVTCKNCGWVHMEVTRKFAENEMKKFNDYFDKLSFKDQMDFYNGVGSSIYQYEHCFMCDGPYTDFRKYNVGDCPTGCTINPIIRRTD